MNPAAIFRPRYHPSRWRRAMTRRLGRRRPRITLPMGYFPAGAPVTVFRFSWELTSIFDLEKWPKAL